MEKRRGWIYGLYDIENPENIRYCGKTISRRGVSFRVYHHKWSARRFNTQMPSARWIRKIGEDRLGFRVLEEVSAEGIDGAEISWISRLRESGMADLNVLPGGDGTSSEAVTGEKNPRARVKKSQVQEIRARAVKQYVSPSEEASRLGINPAAVTKILNNTSWFDPGYDPATRITAKQESRNPTGTHRVWRAIPNSEVERIRRRYLQGDTIPEIIKSEGVPRTSLRRLLFESYGSEESREMCERKRTQK